jgi:hypothetical protein
VTDPLHSKKREGWLGLVLTAVLCLGFLFWWFRPAREMWTHHSTAELLARALGEPGLDQPKERLVIDFDLMEIAILQARLAMVPESQETAARIADPIVQACTIRQIAQSQLSQDAKNLGDVIGLCGRIGDMDLRAHVKEEILLQIAMLGFSDVVLPEAKTPLLRARLARRLAETDGQDTARTLLAEAEAAVPGLTPGEAPAMLMEIAWTRLQLAITDGPQQAFDAISRLPAAAQDELWLELFRVCFGRGDTATADSAAVAARITNPELRRKIELEALQSNIPLRPAEAILAEIRKELDAAPPGPAKIRLLLLFADAHRRATSPEAAAVPLREALEAAKSMADPVQRAVFLAELTDLLPDALLFEEGKKALSDAASAARSIVTPDQRVPVLILILRHAFNNGEMQTAAIMAEEALALAPKIKVQPALIAELANFLTRLGDWSAALSLLPEPPAAGPAGTSGPTPAGSSAPPSHPLPPPPAAGSGLPPAGPAIAKAPGASAAADAVRLAREELLTGIATTAAEDNIGYPSNDPPNRGEPLDRIRNRAITDEAGAAAYLPAVPAGPARARATLAIAKGLLLPPLPADGTQLPGDPTSSIFDAPGEDPLPPVLAEDPPGETTSK